MSVDKVLEFGVMSKSCRIEMAKIILSDCTSLISKVVAKGDGETGAQF